MELRDCPLCGSRPEHIKFFGREYHSVVCSNRNCHYTPERIPVFRMEIDAESYWNWELKGKE